MLLQQAAVVIRPLRPRKLLTTRGNPFAMSITPTSLRSATSLELKLEKMAGSDHPAQGLESPNGVREKRKKNTQRQHLHPPLGKPSTVPGVSPRPNRLYKLMVTHAWAKEMEMYPCDLQKIDPKRSATPTRLFQRSTKLNSWIACWKDCGRAYQTKGFSDLPDLAQTRSSH